MPREIPAGARTDPTSLTTAQLRREVELLREFLESRLDAMDKAVDLLRSIADKSPSIAEVFIAVNHLEKLTNEKFSSIETQFKERDTRTEQASKDNKVAIDAALQAAKEAVGEQNKSNAIAVAKSEAGFTKQIDLIGANIQTMAKGIDDKIDDIKTRLTQIDGHSKGIGESWGFFVGAIGVLFGIAGLATFIIKLT